MARQAPVEQGLTLTLCGPVNGACLSRPASWVARPHALRGPLSRAVACAVGAGERYRAGHEPCWPAKATAAVP